MEILNTAWNRTERVSLWVHNPSLSPPTLDLYSISTFGVLKKKI